MLDVHGESTPVTALLGELGRRWRLLPMLARQDFSARYRSAGLGVLWSVALPLLQGTVLAVVFTHVVRVNTGGVSYSVLVLTGINAWAYLSSSWTMGSTAIVDGAAIAGRVYFPRVLLPAVGPTANLVGYVVGNVVLIGLMAISGVPFAATLLLLPAAMALATVFVALLSAATAVLHVYFRDVRYVVSALLMVLFYATPIIYPMSFVHGVMRLAVLANPATGIVQLSRFAVFGGADDLGVALSVTALWVAVLAVVSTLVYRRYERVAVDRV
jgi:ABC-type polysaccharide/polyol phosphate export permease